MGEVPDIRRFETKDDGRPKRDYGFKMTCEVITTAQLLSVG